MSRSGSIRREPDEKRIDLRGRRLCEDDNFIQPHVYRTIRRIDMGPIVAGALAAVYERQWRRASN